MGRRTKNGDCLPLKVSGAAVLTYKDMDNATYIQGESLNRFILIEKQSDYAGLFMRYTPTDRMVAIQCDGCVKAHIPGNLNCSATMNKPSPMTNPLRLYDFMTKKIIRSNFFAHEDGRGTLVPCTVTFDEPVLR